MMIPIHLKVNGREVVVEVRPNELLLNLLRDRLGLTGTKYGCGIGECGGCTVLADGRAILSCQTLAFTADGKEITTIEGLEEEGVLHPLQQAFLEEGAVQCGYCTPGMILTAYALLLKTPKPTHDEIIRHMDDNLCRCGSHVRIVAAIQEAAGSMKGGA